MKTDAAGREAIKNFLEHMPKLVTLELQGSIHKKSERDQLRANAKLQQVNLVLSAPDETSDSESEKGDESEDLDDSSSSGMYDP